MLIWNKLISFPLSAHPEPPNPQPTAQRSPRLIITESNGKQVALRGRFQTDSSLCTVCTSSQNIHMPCSHHEARRTHSVAVPKDILQYLNLFYRRFALCRPPICVAGKRCRWLLTLRISSMQAAVVNGLLLAPKSSTLNEMIHAPLWASQLNTALIFFLKKTPTPNSAFHWEPRRMDKPWRRTNLVVVVSQ